VRRLAHGEIRDVTLAGQGRRFAVSYLEGLCPDAAFHDPAEHPWCAPLAAGAAVCARELREQAGRGLWSHAGKEACRKMSAPDWRIIGLVNWGVWVAGGGFPGTRALLESLGPAFRPHEVLFARMPPGSAIGLHSDNMNFVLTAHVGLRLDPARRPAPPRGDARRCAARASGALRGTVHRSALRGRVWCRSSLRTVYGARGTESTRPSVYMVSLMGAKDGVWYGHWA